MVSSKSGLRSRKCTHPPNHSGYVEGRYIGETIRTIYDGEWRCLFLLQLTGCSEGVQLYDTLCSIIPTYLPFRDFIPASLYVVEVIVFSTIHESPPPQIIQQATRRS